MPLPQVTADEFREFYLENNRSARMLNILFFMPVVFCGMILLLTALSWLNESPINIVNRK